MILVTGANGFLGSYICRELVANDYPVKALVRENSDISRLSSIENKIEIVRGDILDLPMLNQHFEGVEKVIHCAARISFHQEDCNSLLTINTEGTKNVVNTALKHQIHHFVYISSTAAVSRTGNTDVLDENTKWQETPYTSCYGKSKYMGELEVWRGYSEGMNVVILNPSIILGRENWENGSGQLLKYASEKKKFYPTGDLNFVDVRDVATLTVRSLDENLAGHKFIVNAGAVRYKDFFTKIAEILKFEPPKYAAEGWKLTFAIWGDLLRSLVTGSRRILSREMVRSSASRPVFKNDKIKRELNFEFKTLDESLRWIYTEQ